MPPAGKHGRGNDLPPWNISGGARPRGLSEGGPATAAQNTTNSVQRYRPFCFHHGTLCMGVAAGRVGFGEGPAHEDGGAGEEGESDETGLLFRYLIQYNPVPGRPIEIYRCPLGETPYRRPGIPQLHPTPRLDNVHRTGPRPNTLRNLHAMFTLIPPEDRRTLASRSLESESSRKT